MDSYASSDMTSYSGDLSAFGPTLTSGGYLKGLTSYSYQQHPYSAGSFPRLVPRSFLRERYEPLMKDSHTTDIAPYDTESIPSRGRPSYHSGYEDCHPELGGQQSQEPQSPQAPEIERGNKLLCFQNRLCNFVLLDYALRQTSISLSAQLHGMFFLTKTSRGGPELVSASSVEITCYRRNLFQITGSVTLPHMMQYVVTEQGDRVPIVSQELSVSAVESVEGSPVKIISVPFKASAAGATSNPEEKSEREPTPFTLDQIPNRDGEGDYSVLPFAWKRLQFRVATANNGRRKELQQHFTIRLGVNATLATGVKVCVCQALSGPIIVRGRSPRNFQAKEDVPLADSRPPGRKPVPSPAVSRHSPSDLSQAQSSVKQEAYHMSSTPQHQAQAQPGYFEWTADSPDSNVVLHSSASPSTTRSFSVSPYAQHLPDLTRVRKPSLKRKSSYTSCPTPMTLSIPEATSVSESRSAPTERPYKFSCTRSPADSSPNPSYFPTLASTSLPSAPYSFTPNFPVQAFQGSIPFRPHGVDSAEPLYNYFPGSMITDSWPHQSDNMYQSHMMHTRTLPPATSVGGADSGIRNPRYMNDDMAS